MLLRLILLILLLVNVFIKSSFAFWMWTPETNKWVNPKYSVKETPQEQLDYGKEFFDAKDYKQALQEYRKLIKHYPRSHQAPTAQFNIGLCFESLDKLYEAFTEYQVVIDKYPFSDLSKEIVKKQYDIGVQFLEGKKERGKFVTVVLGSNHNVIEVFDMVIKNDPYGKYASSAQYKIGLFFKGRQLYQEARDAFEQVINDYPDSEWVKPAKYQIALADANRSSDAQYDQRVTQAAVQEFEDFLEDNPDAELSEKAQEQIQGLNEKEAENNFVVAVFYEKQKKYNAAKVYYNTVINDFSNTKWAAKALENLRGLNQKDEK